LPAVNYKISGLQAPDVKIGFKNLEDKPWYVSYEGYLAPETYRVYKNADVVEITKTLLKHREEQITNKMWNDIERSDRSFLKS